MWLTFVQILKKYGVFLCFHFICGGAMWNHVTPLSVGEMRTFEDFKATLHNFLKVVLMAHWHYIRTFLELPWPYTSPRGYKTKFHDFFFQARTSKVTAVFFLFCFFFTYGTRATRQQPDNNTLAECAPLLIHQKEGKNEMPRDKTGVDSKGTWRTWILNWLR